MFGVCFVKGHGKSSDISLDPTTDMMNNELQDCHPFKQSGKMNHFESHIFMSHFTKINTSLHLFSAVLVEKSGYFKLFMLT